MSSKWIIACAVLLRIEANAQELVVYLDSCENRVAETQWQFRRVIVPDPKASYRFTDFYKNGQVYTTGFCKTKSGKLKSGDLVYFRADGKKLASLQKVEGSKNEKWIYWNTLGVETKQEEVVNELPRLTTRTDSTRTEGKCLCYKKTGLWTLEKLKTHKKDEILFEDGRVIHENGIYKTVDDTARYKTGPQEFLKFIKLNLKEPLPSQLKKKYRNISAVITIDKTGKFIEAKVTTPIDRPSEKKIVDVLKRTTGQWTPARFRDQDVGSRITLAIIRKK